MAKTKKTYEPLDAEAIRRMRDVLSDGLGISDEGAGRMLATIDQLQQKLNEQAQQMLTVADRATHAYRMAEGYILELTDALVKISHLTERKS